MKLGILGTSDIALRRFLPALSKQKYFLYAGVATRDISSPKAEQFKQQFGGDVYASYADLLADDSIGAVYIPLPPALHYEWAKKALLAGKHVLLEKPFCTNIKDTEELLNLAEQRHLAVHENYMFLYHSQLAEIKKMLAAGELGEIRLMRMAFGFPKRGEADFRYNRELGGGALLDCGGYPVRLALKLLCDSAEVVQASLIQPLGYEVDLYGSAVLQNENGVNAQIAFGMDNAYKCELEIWGSEAALLAPRIFTAGADYAPELIVKSSSDEEKIRLEADDQFLHSIERFAEKIENRTVTDNELILRQAQLVAQIREKGQMK